MCYSALVEKDLEKIMKEFGLKALKEAFDIFTQQQKNNLKQYKGPILIA